MDLALLSNDDIISLTEAADIVTVDTEGVGQMVGFSLAFDGLSDGLYLPFRHAQGNVTEAQREKIFKVLDTRDALVFHNAVHDLRVLARDGFNYRGYFYDTMLMAHWINEERVSYKLNDISQIYGGKPKQMPAMMSAIIETDGWNSVPVGLMTIYSGNDAYIEHQLFHKLLPEFIQQGFDGELWATEQEFIRDVMGPMMDLGIKVDLAFCARKYMLGTEIMQECKKELGLNPSSSKDLEKLLIKELKLPVIKHTKSCVECKERKPVRTHTWKPSFDKDAMAEYDKLLEASGDSRAKTILRFRGWQKATSSNYKPYMTLADENAILHPGYKLHGTHTGRLSCENPNLQQIPKNSKKEWNGDLKSAFIPREGFGLWTIDYSQLQFRMTVAYANEVSLIAIFNDPTRDIFTEMATGMGWLRDNVKTLVYLILFGGGANRAADAFHVSAIKGKILVEQFHGRYSGIRRIAAKAQKAAKNNKYVRYWTGRRRHFPPGGAPAYRAFNAVIQGGEAEIIKRAMIRLQKEVCDENCRMLLQIHDELCFEITTGMEDQYLPRAQKVMEEAGDEFCKAIGVTVAFKTSVGKWGEK